MSQQNFVKISSFFSSFRTLCVNRYNSHMRASIWLKFGTRIGGLNANISIKFGINLINIRGVTSSYKRFYAFNKVEFLSSLQVKATSRNKLKIGVQLG